MSIPFGTPGQLNVYGVAERYLDDPEWPSAVSMTDSPLQVGDVQLTPEQARARILAQKAESQKPTPGPHWDTLQASLETSSVRQRVDARSRSAVAAVTPLMNLTLLVTVTRNRDRLQLVLDDLAAAANFNAQDRGELNQMLADAGFAERVS